MVSKLVLGTLVKENPESNHTGSKYGIAIECIQYLSKAVDSTCMFVKGLFTIADSAEMVLKVNIPAS